MPETQIIFDTNCVLCSGFVRFVVSHEQDSEMIFINAWSDKGSTLAAVHGMSQADLNKTFLVIEDGVSYTHSSAAFMILGHLEAPWRWLRVLRFLPRPVLDGLYRLIARNRYRWFGFKEACFVPPENMRHRFVD